MDEHIAALSVADLNGDGRPDLVFYGDAKDLTVLYNQGTNGWSDPKTWHIEDGRMDPNALATGDLNGDGRTDVVLLGDNGSLYFLPQLADHTLGEPEKIPYSGTPNAVQITDVNGDGKDDLLLVDFGTARRRFVSGCKCRAGSLARKFISRRSPSARIARTIWKTTQTCMS